MQLENETIRLDIEEPGEGYVGPRFDWTGKITQITFRGRHTFCTAETTDPADLHRGGRGLFNEFGIDGPIGYQECPVGDVFLKPGVGLLTRVSDEPYDFFLPYPVAPGVTRWELDERSVSFEFRCATPRGHAIELHKDIVLAGSGFSIDYALTNRGTTTLETNEYVHNFLAIDGEPLGPGYRLTCSFPLSTAGFAESLDPGNVRFSRGDRVVWSQAPDSPFFFGGLHPGTEKTVRWCLEHTRRRVAIQESARFVVKQFNLWGAGHVVSPELYKSIEIPAGSTGRWSRSYQIEPAAGADTP